MNVPNDDGLPPVIRPPPILGSSPGGLPGHSSARHGPWGFWGTIGLTGGIAGGYLAAQTLVAAIYIGLSAALAQGKVPNAKDLESNGLFLALATWASAPVGVGLAVLFAWLRRTLPVREYLALSWPRIGSTARWLGVLVVFVAASDSLTVWLDRPIVPEVMVDCYRHAGFLPLLWVALLVAGPLAEEFIFRGFLFTGLQHSCLGGPLAILLTAAVWAAIHLQYDLYGIVGVFFGGILLGCARLQTGSLWLCVVMHAVANLIATLEIEILLR